ncbi:AbfB domain-containing protein [Streptomyces fructofermentans]|uniref:AbfB domain-containing protein n=1 Tax=Streptomyces fructofermentans TaxID=152141 RepID=UPI00340E7E6B
MPERRPGPAPAQSAQPPKVWETGETLDESRIPGTRRLWLAGALLLAVLASAVTVAGLPDDSADPSPGNRDKRTTAAAEDEPVVPGTPPSAAPTGKSGLAAAPGPSGAGETSGDASSTGSSAPAAGTGAGADPRPSKPAASGPPPAGKPAAQRRSVQSVNYPDRFWSLGRDGVRLDRVGSGNHHSRDRGETTFTLVPGLADSDCYSFSLGGGRYLRHSQFRLRADRDNGSALFEQDATFCPRPSAFSGAVVLESVNYRGRFLRHRDFQLHLDPFENSRLYRSDSAFRLVRGLD